MKIYTVAITVFIAFVSLPCHGQLTPVEQSLPMIRQLGNSGALAGALGGAAMQCLQANRLDDATKYVDEAIAICRKSGDAQSLAMPLMVAGQILSRLDGEAPQQFMTRLLNAEAGNVEVEAAILKAMGESMEQSGNLVGAIQAYHDHAAKVSKLNPTGLEASWALWQYGSVAMRGKLFELGMPALKKAKQLAIQNGDTALATMVDAEIGRAAMKIQDFDTAESFFQKQLQAAGGNDALLMDAESNLAMALIGNGKMKEAEALTSRVRAASTGMRRGQMEGQAALIAVDNGDAAKAAQLAQQAADSKASILQGPAIAYRAQTVMMENLALAHYQLINQNLPAATAAIDEAENGFEATRNQLKQHYATITGTLDVALAGITPISASISNLRQQIQIANKRYDAALVQAEQGRGQAQVVAMRANFGQTPDDAEAQSISIQEIRKLAAQENVTFVEYSLVQRLDALSTAYLGESHPLSRPSSLYMWVVPPSGEITFREVKLDGDIAKLVEDMRASLLSPTGQTGGQAGGAETNDGSSDAVETSNDAAPSDRAQRAPSPQPENNGAAAAAKSNPSRELYDLLIAPIKSALPTDPNAEVVLVPHGALFAVPFIALEDPQGKHLIDHHTLTTSTSIKLYGLAVTCRQPGKPINKDNVLIVGNPKMPAYRYRPDKPAAPLDPLPGAEIEAQAIAEMFGIQPLIGDTR